MDAIRNYLRGSWFWLIANVGAAFPLVWLLWDQVTDNFSINPISDYTNRTGDTAIGVRPAAFVGGDTPRHSDGVAQAQHHSQIAGGVVSNLCFPAYARLCRAGLCL